MSPAELPEDDEAALALRRFIRSIGPVFFVLGYERPTRWISPAWARRFGGDAERFAADPTVLLDGVHPDSVADAVGLARLLTTRPDGVVPDDGSTERCELRTRLADGSYCWTEYAYGVVDVPDTGHRYLVGILTDSTASHDASVRLAEAARREVDADRATADFVSKLSHELRTPLHAILGYAQLLEMGAGDPTDYIGRLRRAGDHLVHLLDDLLDFSRLSADRLSVTEEIVELGPAIDAALEMLSAPAAARSITIERAVAWPLLVRADATRVRQVVTNIVSNAIKYNVDGGSVRIDARADGDVVRVDISDTGRGVPAEAMARLFVPFDRLGAESTGVAGVGLGLPLSAGLMRAMGGSIDATSVIDAGTTFHLGFRQATAGERTPEARTVVCIDDDEESRWILDVVLQRLPGAVVGLAASGQAGLTMIERLEPSLVVLDRHLPDSDPEELLAAIAAVAPGCPVVMVSSDPQVLAAGFVRSPIVASFTKPLDLDEFVQAVDRLWARRAT